MQSRESPREGLQLDWQKLVALQKIVELRICNISIVNAPEPGQQHTLRCFGAPLRSFCDVSRVLCGVSEVLCGPLRCLVLPLIGVLRALRCC